MLGEIGARTSAIYGRRVCTNSPAELADAVAPAEVVLFAIRKVALASARVPSNLTTRVARAFAPPAPGRGLTMTTRHTLSECAGSAGVRIRAATHEDAALIASMLYESFVEYRDSYTTEAFAATTPASEEVRGRMKEGPAWVALLGGSVVGTAAAVGRGEDLYIRGMAVLPAGRGRSVGERLLRQIEDYASPRGYGRLTLSTTPFLHRAIRLYERFGFRRSEEGSRELFGTPLFTMAKTLGRRR